MSFAYFKDTLDNGLRVVTVETPHLHSALLAVYVRTGSRHETPANNGVSHFLEHMFFRGSAGYPDTVRMNAAIEEVGGNLNGVTMRDQGYYYTPLHPDALGVGMEILGDMLTRPRLTELEVERQIILEEMLDEVDERGRDIDLENLTKMRLFGAHPLAMKIAGTRESVRALTLEQLREHFARHYVARNMVLSVAGPVRRDEVLAQARRHFQALMPGAVTRERPPPRPPTGPWHEHIRHDESQTEFRLTFRTVPEQHPDQPALQVLRRVLDDGLSSRLPYNVVEKRGLAYSIHANTEVFHDVGLFDIEGASAPEKAALVVEEVLSTLSTLCDEGPTADELARAKKRNRMFLDFAQDSPADLVGWFGGTELFHPPESLEEKAAKTEQLTREDVRRAARRYFKRSNLGVISIGQRKGARALEKAVLAGLPK